MIPLGKQLENTADIPRFALAVLDILRFRDKAGHRLAAVHPSEWDAMLAWCDRRQLTLMLPAICEPGALPAQLLERIEARRQRYALRFARLQDEFAAIAGGLRKAGIPLTLLKGMSHAPSLTSDARLRAQGDIDLWIPRTHVFDARDKLFQLGWRPLQHSRARHLAPMSRPTAWRWRGDFFDPEMPIPVELHYELWSERAEGIAAPGWADFWERRVERNLAGIRIAVLREADLIGFAALHLLLHVLHGESPLQRAWELARFLELRAEDDVFWRDWRETHEPGLRMLESLAFSLVAAWFGCRLPLFIGEDVARIPAGAQRWLALYVHAPLLSEWVPNKLDMWLQVALAPRLADRARLTWNRLAPLAVPAPVEQTSTHCSLAMRIVIAAKRVRFLFLRFTRHLLALPPTILGGVRWACAKPNR